VLLDKKYAKWIRNNAYKTVLEKYDWDKISQETKTVYQAVLKEYSKSFWA